MDTVQVSTIVFVMYIVICTYLLLNIVTCGNWKSLITLIHDFTDLLMSKCHSFIMYATCGNWKSLMSKCHSLIPSNNTLDNFINRVSRVLYELYKMLLPHPKGEKVKSNIEKLKDDSVLLERMMTKRKKSNKKASLVANHIKGITNSAKDLGDYLEKNFSEVSVCALSIQIGKHAPIVGIAFAALIPVLEAFEANHEVVATIKDSSTRLKKLIDRICSLLTKVKRERSRFGLKNTLEGGEMKELDTYFFALEDGYCLLGGILQDRKKGFWNSFAKLRLHKERLESWNKAVDEMLKEYQQHRIDMVYYRSLILLKLEWAQISLQLLQIAIIMIGFATVIKKIEDLDRIGKIILFLKNKYVQSLKFFHNCINCAGTVYRSLIDSIPVKDILDDIKGIFKTTGTLFRNIVDSIPMKDILDDIKGISNKEVIKQITNKNLDGRFLIRVIREFCNKVKIDCLGTVACDFMAFVKTVKLDTAVLVDIKKWFQEHGEDIVQSLSGIHGVCNQPSVSC